MVLPRKCGRPRLPKGERKDEAFIIAMTKAQKDIIVRAANAENMPMSEWARRILLAAAKTKK